MGFWLLFASRAVHGKFLSGRPPSCALQADQPPGDLKPYTRTSTFSRSFGSHTRRARPRPMRYRCTFSPLVILVKGPSVSLNDPDTINFRLSLIGPPIDAVAFLVSKFP